MVLEVTVFMVSILETRTSFLDTMVLDGCVWPMQARTQMARSFTSLLSRVRGLTLPTHASEKYYREW